MKTSLKNVRDKQSKKRVAKGIFLKCCVWGFPGGYHLPNTNLQFAFRNYDHFQDNFLGNFS